MAHSFDLRGLVIESWEQRHPRWSALMGAIGEAGQQRWATFGAQWHESTHMLVAQHERAIVGFLRYVVQKIGPDNDCPPVQFENKYLREAKVLAFAVRETHRRRGVGRALQKRLIVEARAQGLFQIRSHSDGPSRSNRNLKLSMGFGVHPIVRGGDREGAYFILPLWPEGAAGSCHPSGPNTRNESDPRATPFDTEPQRRQG